jgi:iron only hydrogenase large subunit-like protein
VFDVNWGADITTMVEAEELVERIKTNGTLPLFTSCCPGWVKFVEFYYPEMIPHLTTSRSPQIHAGGAYKTWWAQKAGVDPKQIVVVSIMPCTSKKYEAHHEKLMIEDMLPVDYVLTSRETGSLFKKYGIDLKTIEPQEPDELGEYSGAAAIYGASGGVMESALRTAAFMLLGEDLPKVEFEAVRGMEGVKKATVMIGGKNCGWRWWPRPRTRGWCWKRLNQIRKRITILSLWLALAGVSGVEANRFPVPSGSLRSGLRGCIRLIR